MTWFLTLILFSPFLAFAFNCCCGCVFATYNFDGVGEVVADNFTVSSGTWAINSSGGTYAMRCTAAGLVYSNSAHIENSPSGKAVFWIDGSSAAVGDEVRCLFGYVDTDNYLFAQFIKIASATIWQWEMRLFERAGGAESEIGDGRLMYVHELTPRGAASPNGIVCCWTGSEASVWTERGYGLTGGAFESARYDSHQAASTASSGTKIGMEVKTLTGSYIEAECILWAHNAITRSSCSCAETSCSECSGNVKTYIQVELDGVVDGTACFTCDNINGTYLLSEWNDIDAGVTIATGIGFMDAPGTDASCQRCIELPANGCINVGSIKATNIKDGSNYKLRVTADDDLCAGSGATGTAIFAHDFGTSMPACDVTAQDVPYVSGPVACDWTGATVTATTISA